MNYIILSEKILGDNYALCPEPQDFATKKDALLNITVALSLLIYSVNIATDQPVGAFIMSYLYRMNHICQIKDFNRKNANNPILQKL